MDDSVLKSLNGQIIIMSAHSYALGRRTYVVSSTVEWLKQNWKYVDDNSRFVILRDTAIALIQDRVGDDCDKQEWFNLLNWCLQDDLELEKKVRNACPKEFIFPLDTCSKCNMIYYNCLCSHDD